MTKTSAALRTGIDEFYQINRINLSFRFSLYDCVMFALSLIIYLTKISEGLTNSKSTGATVPFDYLFFFQIRISFIEKQIVHCAVYIHY